MSTILNKRRRRGATSVLVAISLALAVCSAASADPLSMTFTEARANVGVQLSDAALFAAPDTAPLDAQIDPGNGSITAGDLDVPQFSTHITDPIDADVTVDFDIGIVSGRFTQATGALTLEGEAEGTLTSSDHQCTVSTTPSVLALSTSGSSGGTSPRLGVPFTHGLTGSGSIAGQWTDMQATPVDTAPGGDTFFCENVEAQIEGPGGVWLGQGGESIKPLPIPLEPDREIPTPAPPMAPLPPFKLNFKPKVDVCKVPALAGKGLKAAKRSLNAAGCKIGEVKRPKAQQRGPLVVRLSHPPAGSTVALDSKVSITLGHKAQRPKGQ